MTYELAAKVLEAILLASRRKVKKTILQHFFTGLNFRDIVELANQKLKECGFFIYEDSENVELVTRAELSNYLINFFGLEENKLLGEFLEVLAIVAYGGPISLTEINRLRGKKSFSIIKELLADGFVTKEKNLYRISEKFLKILGFRNEKDLPDYQKFRKELKKEK